MNNKNYKKYTVQLRNKQPLFTFYLAFPIVGIGLTGLLKALVTLNNSISAITSNNHSERLQNLLFCSYLLLIALTILSVYLSPFSFSKNRRMKLKLLKIIEQNDFYKENKKSGQIISSMKMIFYYTNHRFIIEIYPLGGQYTSKMNDLGSILETGLNLQLEAVQDDHHSYTKYIFYQNSNRSIDVTKKWT